MALGPPAEPRGYCSFLLLERSCGGLRISWPHVTVPGSSGRSGQGSVGKGRSLPAARIREGALKSFRSEILPASACILLGTGSSLPLHGSPSIFGQACQLGRNLSPWGPHPWALALPGEQQSNYACTPGVSTSQVWPHLVHITTQWNRHRDHRPFTQEAVMLRELQELAQPPTAGGVELGFELRHIWVLTRNSLCPRYGSKSARVQNSLRGPLGPLSALREPSRSSSGCLGQA